MSFEYDPIANLRHYPVPMSKYGKNQFGETLYRIVFRDSRKHLVGGRWADGETGYHWVPKYPSTTSNWILERWNTAEEFAGMNKERWDLTMVDPVSGWLILGPYPSRGEYDLAWEFDQGVCSDNLDQIVAAIEKGRSRSFQTCRDSVSAEYQKEEKDSRSLAQAEIRDAVTAFGIAPMSSLSGVSRGSKTTADLQSAESLGLPVPKFGGNAKDLRGLSYRSSISTR